MLNSAAVLHGSNKRQNGSPLTTGLDSTDGIVTEVLIAKLLSHICRLNDCVGEHVPRKSGRTPANVCKNSAKTDSMAVAVPMTAPVS